METQLLGACSNGNVEEIKQLLNNEQINLNKTNNLGRTPLYNACENGHIEIVRLLLNDIRVDVI